MSDPRPTRMEPRPRRSGMGLLLPFLLVLLLIYFFMSQGEGGTEFGRRGSTLQLKAFESHQGDVVSRVVWDAPDPRTDFFLIPPADATSAAAPPKEAADTPAPAVLATWPARPQVSTVGAALSCNEVNDRDLLAFFVSSVTPDTHLPNRSVGYMFWNLQNTEDTRRIFVDADVLPEVFVAVPEALRTPEPSPAPTNLTLPPPAPVGVPEPAPAPAVTPPELPTPAAPPAAPEAPPDETAPAPAPVPALAPVPAPAPAPAADVAPTPPSPAETPVVPVGPTVSNPPKSPPTNLDAPADTTAATGHEGQASNRDGVFSKEPVWGFGRIESSAPDRRDRLAALEINGKTARVRSISSDKIQITGSSFVLTAVPTKTCVHIFWRQWPDRGLPNRVINHVVYDGKEFTQEPGLQEGVPEGFFATSLVGDKILMTVLKPASAESPIAENTFAGLYTLQYTLLDAEPTHGHGTGQPPALHWETVTGLPELQNLYELVPVARLDGQVRRLLLHGVVDNEDTIIEVTIPAPDALKRPWPSRPFLASTPQVFPNADRITVIALVAMLAVFATIFLVAWLRPWRWFERPPKDA